MFMNRLLRRFVPSQKTLFWKKEFGTELDSTRLLSSLMDPVKVSQGSFLKLDIDKSYKDVLVHIETKWEDSVHVSSTLSADDKSFLHVTASENGVAVVLDKGVNKRVHFHVFIPEHFDLSIKGPKMSIKLQNKMLGNLLVMIPDGDLTIDKVKGPELGIYIGDGNLHVKKVLEGNLSIQCKSMTGKMINGESVSIAASQSIAIEAMYGSDAIIQADDKIDIGLFRGQLQCECNGDAQIKGIDGSIAVQSHGGNVHLQINSLMKTMSKTDDIHSQSPSGDSAVTSAQILEESTAHVSNSVFAKRGNVLCHLDPEVKLKVFCEGNKKGSSSVDIVSDAFVEESSSGSSCLGHFTGVSLSTKRPSFLDSKSRGVGKINLRGAERQSFYRGGSATGSDHSATATEWSMSSAAADAADKNDFDNISTQDLPSLLIVAPEGKVSMKTMSWIELIKAKHGVA